MDVLVDTPTGRGLYTPYNWKLYSTNNEEARTHESEAQAEVDERDVDDVSESDEPERPEELHLRRYGQRNEDEKQGAKKRDDGYHQRNLHTARIGTMTTIKGIYTPPGSVPSKDTPPGSFRFKFSRG